MLLPFPMQIVQTRDETLLIFEYDHFVRQIYMNRKQHPKNLDSTWMGDSIGRWDGDTLVVDTAGLNEKTWLDQSGHPHSSALHVIERMRRIDHNTLVDDITIDDPQAYTEAGRDVKRLSRSRAGILRSTSAPTISIFSNTTGRRSEAANSAGRRSAETRDRRTTGLSS